MLHLLTSSHSRCGFWFCIGVFTNQIPFSLLHYNLILQSVAWRHFFCGFSLYLLWLILFFIYDCWIVLHMLLLFFGVVVVNISGWACWFGSGSKFSNVSALSSMMTFGTIFGSVIHFLIKPSSSVPRRIVFKLRLKSLWHWNLIVFFVYPDCLVCDDHRLRKEEWMVKELHTSGSSPKSSFQESDFTPLIWGPAYRPVQCHLVLEFQWEH